MQDFERSQLAELMREQNRLLAEIAEQNRPINNVEQLRKRVSSDAWQALQILRIADASLGEVIETAAELAGFKNAAEYVEHEFKHMNDKQASFVQEIVDKENARARASANDCKLTRR